MDAAVLQREVSCCGSAGCSLSACGFGLVFLGEAEPCCEFELPREI